MSQLPRSRGFVKKTSKLSHEETCELLQRWQDDGDIQARNEVVTGYLVLAMNYAKRYARRSNIEAEDLDSVAVMGVMTACDRYDTSSQVPFGAYASNYIKTSIADQVKEEISPYRLPKSPAATRVINNNARVMGEINKELSETGATMSREDKIKKAASIIDVSPSIYKNVFDAITMQGDSLWGPVSSSDEGGSTLESTLDSGFDHVANFEDRDRQEKMKEYLRFLTSDMNDNEQLVIKKRLLADPDDRVFHKELADEMKMTSQGVSLIEIKIMQKLSDRIGKTFTVEEFRDGAVPSVKNTPLGYGIEARLKKIEEASRKRIAGLENESQSGKKIMHDGIQMFLFEMTEEDFKRRGRKWKWMSEEKRRILENHKLENHKKHYNDAVSSKPSNKMTARFEQLDLSI